MITEASETVVSSEEVKPALVQDAETEPEISPTQSFPETTTEKLENKEQKAKKEKKERHAYGEEHKRDKKDKKKKKRKKETQRVKEVR